MSSSAKRPLQPRHWFQFSLRTLLIGMLVFGCGLGWVAKQRNDSHVRQVAISSLEKTMVNVHFYNRRPEWLTFILGGYWKVDSIQIYTTPYDHPALMRLNDATILKFQGAPIEDEALMRIAEFKQLTNLSLERTKITDQAFVKVARLPKLRVLSIGYGNITEKSLSHLAKMETLQVLELHSGGITDQWIAQLPQLARLKSIYISECTITNEGLRPLQELKNLEFVAITRIPITDLGLQELARIPRLKSLDLDGTEVTKAGCEKLKSAMPDLKIRFSNDEDLLVY